MRKTLLFLLLITALFSRVGAQDFKYGAVTREQMDMKSYAKDTSAHAVVLQEFGKSRIDVGGDDNIKLQYLYHVKIKIFDSKAFDKGTVEIPVYNNSDADSFEDVQDIKGVTYYLDDNGTTQKVELENKKIYPVKENKHWAIYKFALPGIRNGCVIEYTYKIESPYFENFHAWHFQADIPKIYSEYEVHIPAFWTYNASIKGFLKLTKNTSDVETSCFSTHGASCDCSHIVYGMGDIPAFVEEDYMTSSKNFSSTINFELVEYTSPYDGSKHKITKEWRDIDYQLKNEIYFGNQLKRKGLLKDRVASIIAGKTDDISKARAIYTYWQKWFKWNESRGIYSENISKAFDTHSGSDADINLSLVTALSTAGLNAETVLLSTRDNGMLNTLYPVLGDFNYVVAKVNIGDQSYLLDATDPMLPFGVLPFRCLNDKGRVFSLDKPSYFMDLNLPQKEKSTYTYDFTLHEDGKLTGKMVNYSVGYEAYKKRVAIRKFNSTDEYVENLNEKFPKMKILKSEILNLDSLDLPLGEIYEVEIDLYNKTGANKITFNPFFMKRIITNPFKLAERSYPVDWGMPSDDRFILTIHLPAGYTIETPPQALSLSMPDNGGKFLTYYEPEDNGFKFSNVIQFNKSIYSSEEYPYLKELYNKIIQSEKSEMIFKKK
ncbi:DUF3857 domain-containing protein [Mucilaginibacter sp.]|uniref:DUF3857 domain-containing protein n=1 Tax=Mucilaginibacter sp. TaxID=1882438 RepID=UPI003D0D4D09